MNGLQKKIKKHTVQAHTNILYIVNVFELQELLKLEFTRRTIFLSYVDSIF